MNDVWTSPNSPSESAPAFLSGPPGWKIRAGLLLVLVTLCLTAAPSVALTRVVKLRMASPAEIAAVLRQSFGRSLRVAEAAMINAVILNSEDASDLAQAEALIANLDQPPAMLRFSLQLITEEEAREWQAGISQSRRGTRFQADRHTRRDRGRETRTLVGLEGQPLSLTDETTRVIDLSTPFGPQTAILKSERGLRILGRRAGEDGAVVEVRYADGPELSASQILSQVRVRFGEWSYLGDVAGSTGGAGSDVQMDGRRGHANTSRHSRSLSRHYLVRVDLAGP